MKRLIINADDLGLCEGANLGILRAHRHGIVTSATVMMNMPGAGDALTMAPPSLGVGVHLTLTGGRPLCEGVPTLTDDAGNFLKLPALRETARTDELERELRAQVNAFRTSGLRPTHLDSHHHVHLEMPAVGKLVRLLADELQVPVCGMSDAVRFTGRFYGQDRVSPAALLAIIDEMTDGETVEVMCHPAYLDPELLFGSRYALPRVHELATLTDSTVRDALSSRHVHLISYRDLQKG